jgi:hypothetical protein
MHAGFQTIQPPVFLEAFKYRKDWLPGDDVEVWVPKRGPRMEYKPQFAPTSMNLAARSNKCRRVREVFGSYPSIPCQKKKRGHSDSGIPPDGHVPTVGKLNRNTVLADPSWNLVRNMTGKGTQRLRGRCEQSAQIVVVSPPL